MNDRHEPTPEFLAHLERETRFALRRERAGVLGSAASLGLGSLRTAALVVLSLGAGMGVVFAAERVQETRRVERELAGNRVRADIAARRLAALRGRAEVARARFEAGLEDQSGPTAVERLVLAAERALRHVELEREELALGGGSLGAVLDLTAPLVGPRDFVSEHLRVDRDGLAADLGHARREHELAVLRREAGSIPEAEVARALDGVAAVERRLAWLDQRLALRAEFLQGRTSREVCERSDLRLEVEARRASAEALLRTLRSELARSEQLFAAGVAPAPEEPRLAVAEAEAELALIALEVEALR
jgi:hypothetical protein